MTITLSLSACDIRTSASPNQPTASSPAARQGRWTAATARQLREAIGSRAANGLDHLSFDATAAPGMPDGDAALTRTALAYAAALSGGASDPTKLFEHYTMPRPQADLGRGLAAALSAGKVADWLKSLPPQDENYARLSKAYLALRKDGNAHAPAIPDAGDPLTPGATDPRVPAIAQALVASDYLDQRAAAGDVYTLTIAAAVKQMQADYGIKPDGMIGADALAILNLSDADRARAIAVNMERLRWLHRNAPATRIDVNLAAARLTYWRDNQIVDTRKVVVGEPDKETPQLGSPIFRLVANPTWTVPRSVQNKEIAGKGAGYLKANNMMWKDGWIVQQSGPKNSLGLVKFDMQNDQAIYLHDTPAKQLFADIQRQRSHGCVRVDNALGFAELLAKDEGVTEEWHRARASGKEAFVKLPREIPVRLLYQTVLFDEGGEAVIRNDPYGWNDRVAAALGFPGGGNVRVRTQASDDGP